MERRRGRRSARGKFVLRNAFGPRVVRCEYFLARGSAWWPSKVTLDGVDITNVPTDFSKHEDGQLEVVVTQTPARIVGTVTDAEGRPVNAPWIVVNAAERALWQHWAATSNVTQGDTKGRFSLAVLPGAYRVNAVPQRHSTPGAPPAKLSYSRVRWSHGRIAGAGSENGHPSRLGTPNSPRRPGDEGTT